MPHPETHEPVAQNHEQPDGEQHSSNAPSPNTAEQPANAEEPRVEIDPNAAGLADVDQMEENAAAGKYADRGDHPTFGLYIYIALQATALLFMVVATPIELFKLDTASSNALYRGNKKDICLTAWGAKDGCRTAKYFVRDYTPHFCFRVKLNFRIVQAFSLLTIIFMVIGLALGFASTRQLLSKGAVAAIAGLGMLLCLIPWGIVAGMYHQLPCCETNWSDISNPITNCAGTNMYGIPIRRFKEMGSYGAGFGLMVTAFCLQFVGCIFAIAPL